MMGLMLHANAKSCIKKQTFKNALDVLYMAEVSCNAAVISVHNSSFFKKVNS